MGVLHSRPASWSVKAIGCRALFLLGYAEGPISAIAGGRSHPTSKTFVAITKALYKLLRAWCRVLLQIVGSGSMPEPLAPRRNCRWPSGRSHARGTPPNRL